VSFLDETIFKRILYIILIQLGVFMCAIEYYDYEDYKQWDGKWELIYPTSIDFKNVFEKFRK
jgi:hypothetical protein